MIVEYQEVDEARVLLECAYRDLQEERQPATMPLLGAMLEVPAALYQIEILARRVDFFSCGEIAGDPLGVILLLGMGVDALSMAVPSIPRVKWVIRAFTQNHARELLKQVLSMEDPAEIRQFLRGTLEEVGLGALMQSVK